MPEVFQKNCKVKVIEYGDNCNTEPFFTDLMEAVKRFFRLPMSKVGSR